MPTYIYKFSYSININLRNREGRCSLTKDGERGRSTRSTASNEESASALGHKASNTDDINEAVQWKQIRGMPRCWVHPRKESDRMATGGEECDLIHWIIFSLSLASAEMISTFPALPRSLTFSTPEGIIGWCGKGRIKVWREEDGWVESSGSSIGRFFGVTNMVMVRPRRRSWWVKSRSGSMWPCAG